MTGSKHNNQEWVQYLEAEGLGVWEWDTVKNEVFYSKQWKSMLGYAEDEIGTSFDEFQSRLHPEDNIQDVLASITAHLEGKSPVFSNEIRLRTKSGDYRWILAQGSIIERDEQNRPLRVRGMHKDITASHEALLQLTEQKKFIGKVLSLAPIFVYIFDLIEQKIIYCNEAAFTLLGYTPAETQAHDNNLIDMSLFHPDDLPKVQANFFELTKLEDGESKAIEYRIKHQDGQYRVFRSYDTPFLRDADQQVTQIVGTAVDITQLRDSEVRLEYLAHHDPLTNLPNRTLLHARLEHSLQVSERLGLQLCVCFIDLDNFKIINDSYGHSVGDKVLIEVANRMQGIIRKGDTLARVGGDEFVLVLDNIDLEGSRRKVLQKFIQVFERPFTVDNKDFNISMSMGISRYPLHGQSIETLNQHADTAMYEAKLAGKNTFKIYSETMSLNVISRMEMEIDLKAAVQSKQFELYYQPQVCLKTHKVVGFEALIRWNHPIKGLISPDDFIPLAEELRLIIPMGLWVLQQACVDLKQLQETLGYDGRIAVNVSGTQLEDSDFISQVQKVMELSEVSPKKIELEVTESVITNDPKGSIARLNALRAMLFNIAMDDFGTGYSSLSDLKKLPVTKLKIDKSFVDYLPDGEDDQAISTAIISLAKAMKMSTLAEGIETEAQMTYLAQNGCEYGQGFWFSKPKPLAEIMDWLASRI
jgi:diguanylate cyclase (GGDEF)-like protein/PAS domain S-box-containing protein